MWHLSAGRQIAFIYTESSLGYADTAAGPFVLAVKRFGAAFKEFPNLAKYADNLEVSNLACLLSKCTWTLGSGPSATDVHSGAVKIECTSVASCWPAIGTCSHDGHGIPLNGRGHLFNATHPCINNLALRHIIRKLRAL